MTLLTRKAPRSPLGRELTCPRCGAATHDRLASFPRCPRCGEYLRKCRYCRNFDFRVYGCTVLELAEELDRQPDLDEANECPLYDTTLVVERLGRKEWRAAAWRIALAVFPALLLIAAMFALIPRPTPAGTPALLLTVRVPENVNLGELCQFDLIVNNIEAQPTPLVRLWVSDDLLKGFEPPTLDPEPRHASHGRKGTFYDYGPLEPNGTLSVRGTAKPRKAGIFRLRAVLLGGRVSKSSQVTAEIEILP